MTSDPTLGRALEQAVSERTERTMTTPDGVPVTVGIADISERAGAALVDLFIVLLIGDILLLIFAMIGAAQISSGGASLYLEYRTSDFVMILALLLQFLVRLVYFPYMEYTRNGQTIGKKIFRLRVVDRAGGPLRFETVIMRNLTREVEFYMPMMVLAVPMVAVSQDPGASFMIGLFLLALTFIPLTNHERMRGGDMLAGTWVITVPDVALPAEVSRESGVFTDSELRQYGVKELQVLAEVIRGAGPGADEIRRAVAERIRKRLNRGATESDRTFLEAFYTALREHLEHQKLMTGTAPRDKAEAQKT